MPKIAPEKAKVLNEEMLATLQSCAAILLEKASDYGDDNFADAAVIASILCRKKFTRADVAAMLLGIKLARYGRLTGKHLKPKNEPLHDTVVDAVNYVILMERERQKDGIEQSAENKLKPEEDDE